MKPLNNGSSPVLIACSFAAGIAALALLQFTGIVSIGSSANEQSSGTSLSNVVEPADMEADRSIGKVSSIVGSSDNTISIALLNDVEFLKQELQSQSEAAAATSTELTAIKRRLGVLQMAQDTATAGAQQGQLNFADTGAQPPSVSGRRSGNERGNRGLSDGESQYTDLLAAGVEPQVASDIRQRNDQYSLARLELIDQAEREGWQDSERFTDAITSLNEDRLDLRTELGDDAYDKYLFESGRPNRVVVNSIIGGSASEQAGIEQGDTIWRYANNRVFGMRELQRATRQGQRGESVAIDILRNGTLLNLDIPRGPLGITLASTRAEPS